MATLRISDVTTGEDRTQEYSLVNRKQAEGYKHAIEKNSIVYYHEVRIW